MTRWLTMDASVSPQLDSTLNDSEADGEENHSEASPSSVDPNQVCTHTHTHLRIKCPVIEADRGASVCLQCQWTSWSSPAGVGGRRAARRPAVWRSDGAGPGSDPGPSDLRHTVATSPDCPGEREKWPLTTQHRSCFTVLWRPSQFSRRKILIIWEQFQAKS